MNELLSRVVAQAVACGLRTGTRLIARDECRAVCYMICRSQNGYVLHLVLYNAFASNVVPPSRVRLGNG
jgi:hypothetical protein